MLQFEKVSKAFGGEVILEELSLKLNKGERCGLVGRNGSGKTTLLRMITGEESIDSGSIECPKNYTLGYLSQHLHFSHSTLIQETAEHLSEEEVYKAEKILFGLGFKENDLEAAPETFSGGYQLRIHLAKVLLQEPDCLLLDEPTNYLDVVSIRWITRFLRNWRGELILISHDRDFMDQVTTHTLGVHRHKVKKYKGGTEKYYSQLLYEEQVHEKTRASLEKKRAHAQAFVTRLGAKASKAAQAQSRKKMLARMPVLEELAKLHHLDFSFPYHPFPGRRMVEVTDIAFRYEGMPGPLITGFNLTIDKGDRIAIIGKNGRGKSTLLRLLAQDLTPQEGDVKVSSNVRIGLFGQSNIERLHPELTIEEEIATASPHLTQGEVRKICGTMMFSGDRAKKPIQVLSGGERSRVLLGKILASPCNLLLLDEPTNHLDMESIEALMEAMEAFEGSIVIVSHSEMILKDLPTKFIVCHQGDQHLFHGDYAQFLEKEGWEEQVPKKAKPKSMQKKPSQLIQKKMRSVEREICSLEQSVEEECRLLIKASEQGERERAVELSKGIDEKKQQIDLLFNELEYLEEKGV